MSTNNDEMAKLEAGGDAQITRLLDQNNRILSDSYRRSKATDEEWVSYLSAYVHRIFNMWRTDNAAIDGRRLRLFEQSFAAILRVIELGAQVLLSDHQEGCARKLMIRCVEYLWKMLELIQMFIGDIRALHAIIEEFLGRQLPQMRYLNSTTGNIVLKELKLVIDQPWQLMASCPRFDLEFAACYLASLSGVSNEPSPSDLQIMIQVKFIEIADALNSSASVVEEFDGCKIHLKALIALLPALHTVFSADDSLLLIRCIHSMLLGSRPELRFNSLIRKLSALVVKKLSVIISPSIRQFSVVNECVLLNWLGALFHVYSDSVRGTDNEQVLIDVESPAEIAIFTFLFDGLEENNIISTLGRDSRLANDFAVTLSMFAQSLHKQRAKILEYLFEFSRLLVSEIYDNLFSRQLLMRMDKILPADYRFYETMLKCFRWIFVLRCQLDLPLRRFFSSEFVSRMIDSAIARQSLVAIRVYAEFMSMLFFLRIECVQNAREKLQFFIQTISSLLASQISPMKTRIVLNILMIIPAVKHHDTLIADIFHDNHREGSLSDVIRQLSADIGEDELGCYLFFQFLSSFRSQCHQILRQHQQYLNLVAYWILLRKTCLTIGLSIINRAPFL
jgi:hypothetical protein